MLITKDKLKECTNSLKSILDIEKYRFNRYKIPFCLLMIECKSLNCLENIKAHIRKTDTVLSLDKNLFAVIFRYVDYKNGGHKAAENLIHHLEKCNKSLKIYGGLTCADEENISNITSRALFALNRAKNRDFSNIEDDYLF